MIEKKIDIYADEFIKADLNNVELTGELSNVYAMFAVSNIQDKKVFACEYFEFDGNDTWNNIFNGIKSSSKILANNYGNSRLFYNFPEVLVVPALYDGDEKAKVYLNTFYNSLKTKKIQSDKLPVFDNVSVIYAVDEEINQAVQSNFNAVSTSHHSYSKLLQNIGQTANKNSQQLYLFFYNQMFVLVLTDNSHLKFIKSVNYQQADDILYFIMDVTKQYAVNIEELQLKISGFINTGSKELMLLQKYFLHIDIEEPAKAKSLNNFFKNFPQHYFTPFFYLPA